MRTADIEDNIEHLRYAKVILATVNCSKFITRQRRRVGDFGENVAKVFGAATFGARLRVRALPRGKVWRCRSCCRAAW